jgi:hypothetical protein
MNYCVSITTNYSSMYVTSLLPGKCPLLVNTTHYSRERERERERERD